MVDNLDHITQGFMERAQVAGDKAVAALGGFLDRIWERALGKLDDMVDAGMDKIKSKGGEMIGNLRETSAPDIGGKSEPQHDLGLAREKSAPAVGSDGPDYGSLLKANGIDMSSFKFSVESAADIGCEATTIAPAHTQAYALAR